MALLSELVKVVADVEGLDAVSVGIFARHAREAGLIAQGGRGRSAAQMSTRDAANLLIAVNACAYAKDVPTLVPAYRDLRVSQNAAASRLEVCKPGASFGDDLELLIDWCGDPKKRDRLVEEPIGVIIRLERPVPRAQVSVNFWKNRAKREQAMAFAHYGAVHKTTEPGRGDRHDETVFSVRTLNAVAAALNT